MKKSKLLMPILGVTATLGAVVPTMVACNKNEDTTGLDVKLTFAEVAGLTTTPVTKTLPKAHISQMYYAVIEWRCTNESGDPVDTYCSNIAVANSVTERTIDYRMINGINRVTVMINPAWVQSNMEITVTPAVGEADATVQLTSEKSDIPAYDEYGNQTTVPGITMSSPITGFTDDTNVVEFVINLPALEASYQKVGKTLVGCTDLVFYMANASGVRQVPWDRGYVYLGNKYLNSDFSDYNALHIYFEGGLTEDGVKEEVYGYYDFSFDFTATNLNGGNCYAFDRRALSWE